MTQLLPDSTCSAEHATNDTSAADICTTFIRGLTHIMDLRLPPLVRVQILFAGLEAAKKLGNTGLTVLHTGNLGRVYRVLGELDLSVKCHEWVLKMATAEGHREDQAYAHHHIGLAMLDKGEILSGVYYLEKALDLSRNPVLGLKSLEASTLNNLGTAYLLIDRPAKAMEYLRSALDRVQVLNDPHILTLTNLATALVALKQEPDLAVEMLENALGIAEDLGAVRAELAARQALVEALEQCGRLDDALATAKVQQAGVQ